MNVFDALVEEHRTLASLVRTMRRSLKGAPASRVGARARVLGALGPALEEHEEIEEAVLGIPTYATQRASRRSLEAAAAGHAALERMIKEARRSLSPGRIEALAAFLLAHFRSEEKELWPHYRRAWRKMSPSVHRFFRSTIDNRIRSMKEARRRLGRREP